MEALEPVHTSLPSNFKEPPGGGKRDRKPCSDGNHDFECNTTSCADCWVPPCPDNQKKEQDHSDASHDRKGKTNKDKHQEYLDAAEERGKIEELGAAFEKLTLQALSADEVIYYQYFAHCRKCHIQAELDIVTKTSVIECKNSSSLFDMRKMKNHIDAIRRQCFPDKKLVHATQRLQKDRLAKKLKQWARAGYDAGEEILGV